jgi:hypothetical protein
MTARRVGAGFVFVVFFAGAFFVLVFVFVFVFVFVLVVFVAGAFVFFKRDEAGFRFGGAGFFFLLGATPRA